MKNNLKILIFIVAYNAQEHLIQVLKRIPKSIYNYDYEILVIDDSSTDNTFKIGKKYQSDNKDLNLTVLYNPVNQGYGGNQKLGYQYAILNKFDVVVLLHGDGQYAPELIQDMISPIIGGAADAVIGSRMLAKGEAIKGGMPLYKYIGNRILTTIQNILLKSRLTEFHSGYRAYSVRLLKRIPFQRNTDDYHFDTQILIQIIRINGKVVEIPIPTYYGSEICYVNGIKYAWNVLKSTINFKLHDLFILYRREYDINHKPDYNLKFGYTSSHSIAINTVKNGSKVLDLGCGEGYIGKVLKDRDCTVTGVDNNRIKNKNNIDKFINLDLDNISKLKRLDEYEFILMLDIVEHLKNPELFLDKIREKTKLSQPKIIITVPNIAFFIIRSQLLFSHFNYGKQGILDFTHRRLFTFASIKRLLKSSGYKIEKSRGIPAPFPKALGINKFSMFLLNLNKALIFLSKGLFSYQIYIEAYPTPVVGELLKHSVSESSNRKY